MADSQGRSNIWAFIIYPDSWPTDYKEIIASWHIPCCLSPLHDADKNGDETEKKPHRHILINFGSGKKKSFDQLLINYCTSLHGSFPIAIDSERGMIRYFVHIDNPEKAQYEIENIECFSGYDCSEFFKPSASLANSIMNDIKKFIIDNEISEFRDLQVYAMEYPDTWGYVLNMYNCLSIYKLIDSIRNSQRLRRVNK